MRWEIVTFDCYGTLIDWNAGIGGAFGELMAREGLAGSAEEAIGLYHQIEPVVQAEAFRPYREILAESARRVSERMGWGLDARACQSLPESLPSWVPFNDTNRALERLTDAGIRLGILSNIDEDLIAATRRQFTVDFDLVITAQQVGSYKPAHGHFLRARTAIGGRRWLHAAQSWFHDVVPATQLGIPAAWVNRLGEAGGEPRPLYEVANMEALADALA